jgi:protein-L-isoaspartate(D-aspartate) O-methyltransferase
MENNSLARLNMVESQVRPNDVTDTRILAAMMELPRENFVPAESRALAYSDQDVQVKSADANGRARCLLAPMTVARLIHAANVQSGDLVLDIGCATGYSSAILSSLADSVVALECDESLAALASDVLPALQIANVAVVTGPLQAGYPSEGPYDAIVVNGEVSVVPEALCEQLKDGGRLVAVLNKDGVRRIWVFRRSGEKTTGVASHNASAPVLPGFEAKEHFVF